MNAATTARYGFVLTDAERATLLDILEEVLKETQVELRRTEASGARRVVRSKEATIEAILGKVREAGPAE
jgi:hypothetical protein